MNARQQKLVFKKIKNKDENKNSRKHSPTLDTIKMVEELISKNKSFPSKNKLSRALPRQVQNPTLNEILCYLEESNKIMYDKNNEIVWIFANNPKIKKLIKNSAKI